MTARGQTWGDFHIEDRVIPRHRVAQFHNFMENVRRNRCSTSIYFAFPASGIYHDLVRHYLDHFRQDMEENHSITELTLFIEPHANSDFDHSALWASIGDAISAAANIRRIGFNTDGNMGFDAVCHVIRRLRRVVDILLVCRAPGVQAVTNESLGTLSNALKSAQSLEKFTFCGFRPIGSIDFLFSELGHCGNLKEVCLVGNSFEAAHSECPCLEQFLRHRNLKSFKVEGPDDSQTPLETCFVKDGFVRQFADGLRFSAIAELTVYLKLTSQETGLYFCTAVKESNVETLELRSPIFDMFPDPGHAIFSLLGENHRLRKLSIVMSSDVSAESSSEFWFQWVEL